MADAQDPTEEEIDAVIAEFDGDMREAVRALMHDLTVLAADLSGVVSRGYVRGRVESATVLPLRIRIGPR
jgi:hypothetical protein